MRNSYFSAVRYSLKNSRIRALAALTVVISILIVAIGIVSYISSKSIVEKQIREPQNLTLQIDRQIMHSLYSEMDLASIKVLNEFTTSLIYNTSLQNEISYKMRIVNTLCTQNIESIYVYNMQNDTIIASQPYGYYSEISMFDDIFWIESAKLYLKDTNSRLIVRKAKENGAERKFVSLLRKITVNNQMQSIIAVNCDYNKFFKFVRFSENIKRFYFDENNNILFEYPASDVGKQILSVMESKENKSLATVSIGKNKYFCTYLKSDLAGWTICSYYLMNDILYDINLLRNIIFFISFISIVVGISSVLYYNSKIFAPIKRIEKLIVQNYGHESNMSDNSFVASFAENLIRSNIDLCAIMEKDQITLREKFLEDLINKKVSDYEIKQRWKGLFSDWTSGLFTVAILSIDDYYQWKSSYNESDEFLLKYSLSKISNDLLNENFRCISFDNSADKIIYLTQPQNQESSEALKNCLVKIIKSVNECLKISVSFGASDVFCDCAEIKKAYKEADAVLMQRLYNGYSYVNSFDEYMRNENKTSFKLLEDKMIDDICSAVETNNPQIAIDIIRNSCTYFRKNAINPRTAITYFENILIILKGRVPCEDDLVLIDPYMLYTISLEDLQIQFDEMIKRLITLYDRNEKSKEEEIVEKMCIFMNDHYAENISVNDVCDYVGLSVSYISGLFKRFTNNTIYDYLTNIRIARANELLCCGAMTIGEIAVKVGYQNETSFRRVYKKVRLITPGEYRDICRKKVMQLS